MLHNKSQKNKPQKLKKHKQARPVPIVNYKWALIKHIDVFPVSRFTNVSFTREHISYDRRIYIYFCSTLDIDKVSR